MITNAHIDRLLEIPLVQEVVQKNQFKTSLCQKGDDFTLLLYRLPYVIELRDTLVENYLETSLSDLDSERMIFGGSALGCCVHLGLIDIEALRQCVYEQQYESFFLSESALKLSDLYSDIEAFDKLLSIFEQQGMEPLVSKLDNGAHEFGTQPMYAGLKDKYLRCISSQPA